jgi:gas vesicle protein
MSKKSNSLFSFLLGAAIGSTLGVLFAPDKGLNTRKKLSYNLDKYKIALEAIIERLITASEKPTNPAKSRGEKVENDTKEKAEELLADVDELIGQIKKK